MQHPNPNPTVNKQTRQMCSLTCDFFKGKNLNTLTSFSEPGICPPIPDVECPDEIESYCTDGDDYTCAEDLKCCYTGCEFDCLGKCRLLFCIIYIIL